MGVSVAPLGSITFSSFLVITVVLSGIVFSANAVEPQFNDLKGLGVDLSGNVFVADTDNNRIQKFTNTGKFIRTWGSTGTDDGSFSLPTGISVDSDDNVYVNDGANLRIQKFTNNGKFIRKSGSVGSGDGQFLGPWGIGIDLSTDKVYMTDVGIRASLRSRVYEDWRIY